MSQNARQLAARMAALNFVLAHGEAISAEAGPLRDLLAEMLLRFEGAVEPAWNGYAYRLRFHLAFEMARSVLTDLLPGFNRGLPDHDRFEWRVRLCRLLLAYMGEEDKPGVQNAFGALVDYYCLVWDAQFTGLHYRGKILPHQEADEYDADAPTHFTIFPN